MVSAESNNGALVTMVFIVLAIRCLLPNNVHILKSQYKSFHITK